MEDGLRFVVWFFVLGYSCILHECAHVYAALKLGDTTGRDLGRLTLNPIPHIDPIWTIALPIINYFTGAIPIAGPKPAPVNPLNFREPRSGFMITALAGPATNIALCLLGVILLWLLFTFAPDFAGSPETNQDGQITGWSISMNSLFCGHLIFINLFLAAFNLIPIPPLDGSRFLQWLLGEKVDALMNFLSMFGLLVLLLVVNFVSSYVLQPVGQGAYYLLANLVHPEYARALIQDLYSR